MNESKTAHFDLAATLPADEVAWQRACEIEQKAAHEYFLSRAQSGHSVAATIFGTLVALGSMAKAVFRPAMMVDLLSTLKKAVGQ